MLILTRKVGQSIKIDGKIEVIVLERFGNQVKLGIKAPKDVVIERSKPQKDENK